MGRTLVGWCCDFPLHDGLKWDYGLAVMSDETRPDDLLAEIERFITAARISATAFGASAVNDGHLVRDLRAGRKPSEMLVARIRAYIAAERQRIVSLLHAAPDEAA